MRVPSLRCLAVLVFACALANACVARTGALPVSVPANVSVDASSVRGAVEDARAIVRAFAKANAVDETTAEVSIDHVEVFATQSVLWRRVLELNDLPPDTPLTSSGLAAGLERGVLVVVDPREYERIRPEYAAGDGWTRLIAHEIVHSFHVGLLNGDEEAMGPRWFFEGLAFFGAGQRSTVTFEGATARDVLQRVHAPPERGAYEVYGAAVRFFAARAPLKKLVAMASDPNFVPWLARL